MYIPKYLKDIRCEVKIMISEAEKALEKIEKSAEYTDHLHPFHASAVATYNHLISIVLTLDGLEVEV